MAEAGWYPDPSGTPGQLRYFDGANWTNDVLAQLNHQLPSVSVTPLPQTQQTPQQGR